MCLSDVCSVFVLCFLCTLLWFPPSVTAGCATRSFPDDFLVSSPRRPPAFSVSSRYVCSFVSPLVPRAFPSAFPYEFDPICFSRVPHGFLSISHPLWVPRVVLLHTTLCSPFTQYGLPYAFCWSVTPRIPCVYPRAFSIPFAHAFSMHRVGVPLHTCTSFMPSAMSNPVRSPMDSFVCSPYVTSCVPVHNVSCVLHAFSENSPVVFPWRSAVR